jgi:signal transduction histidine kinase
MRPEQGWRLDTKLLAVTIPLIIAVTGLAAWAVQARTAANLQEKLTQRARSLHTQIMADRHYYASVIVPRIEALGGSLGEDYQQVHGRFPLPATFVREVAEVTAKVREGYAANLISPWAINPEKGVKDQFQRDAFAYLRAHPAGQFMRIDTAEGRAAMRVLMSDFASAQSCVDCHNRHPKSPRHDFKVGDLMGGLEIVIPMEQYVQESRRDFLLTVAGGTGLCLLVVGVVVLGTRRVVTWPLVRLSEKMRAFVGREKGPLTQAGALPPGDEVARLDEAFETMRETIAYKENELLDANARLEQRVAERTEALQLLEEQYRVTMASLPVSVVRLGKDRTIRLANRTFYELLQRRPKETIGQPLSAVLPAKGIDEFLVTAHAVGKAPLERRVWETECVMAGGEPRVLRLTVSGIRRADDDDDDDDDDDIVLVIENFTERRQAEEALRQSEEQLRQSQKIEAVGQLAGGIAHDFNNMLTVINGYSQLLLSRLGSDAPHRAEIEEINTAGSRAEALTRQLLAFSRKQMLAPSVLTLNAVVTNLEQMLQRLIGEDIELRAVLQPQLGRVLADPGQIEQVIMNLALNARDAMPQGGILTIETMNVEMDESYAQRSQTVSAGPHVMMAVSDTGCGMDEATQARIFEPFFTTKEQGKGTGLGLATVYGIVKQSGGSVWVYSEPGHGTTFKIYLPRVEGTDEAVAPTKARDERVEGSETILVVEDDEGVRKLTVKVLRATGYTVLEAANGNEAIALCERHQGTIHLLATDVVMPGMGGRVLAERLIAVVPGMKVLYLSGYTDDTIVRHGVLNASVEFLQKPFTPLALARKVREVLDSP